MNEKLSQKLFPVVATAIMTIPNMVNALPTISTEDAQRINYPYNGGITNYPEQILNREGSCKDLVQTVRHDTKEGETLPEGPKEKKLILEAATIEGLVTKLRKTNPKYAQSLCNIIDRSYQSTAQYSVAELKEQINSSKRRTSSEFLSIHGIRLNTLILENNLSLRLEARRQMNLDSDNFLSNSSDPDAKIIANANQPLSLNYGGKQYIGCQSMNPTILNRGIKTEKPLINDQISSFHCDPEAYLDNKTNPKRIDSPAILTQESKLVEKIKLDIPDQFLRSGKINIEDLGKGYKLHAVIGKINGDGPDKFITNPNKLPVTKVVSTYTIQGSNGISIFVALPGDRAGKYSGSSGGSLVLTLPSGEKKILGTIGRVGFITNSTDSNFIKFLKDQNKGQGSNQALEFITGLKSKAPIHRISIDNYQRL